MTEETKTLLIKRLKSLGWRVGMFVAVSVVAFLSDNLSLFSLSATQVALASFVLAEATKFLNSRKG